MKRVLTALLSVMLLLSFAEAETLTISMVGDCTVGDQYMYAWYPRAFTTQITEKGLDYPFSAFADRFAADDLTIANCEGVFTSRRPADPDKEMSLCAPKEFAEVFALGNVEVCNITNNHGHDFGDKGREDTIAALESFGVGAFGDKLTWTTEIKGVKIGICGYTYPFSDDKMRNFQKRIDELRADGCTFIIASCHWGKEMSYDLNSAQLDVGTMLIDMGADMVYGHGPHVLQPIRLYNGKLVFYSMSNFTFGANRKPKDDDTAVVQVTFDILENGMLQPAELMAIPAKMHYEKDFRPYELTDEEAKLQVWRKMYSDGTGKNPASNLPESFLTTGYVDLKTWMTGEVQE